MGAEETKMKSKNLLRLLIVLALPFVTVLFGANKSFAHCDGMDGPVVKAAQKALDTGNVNLVLIWVQKNDEGEIKTAFRKTLAVRKLNPQAKELADMYFFETLVRTHRAGEGASYTGLKPAGRDLGPAIPAADKALDNGKVEPLVKLLTEAAQTGIREQFEQAIAKKKFKPDDVEAGREFIESYVPFIHYVERLYEAAKNPIGGHFPESAEAATHTELK
jgi:Family of unknown function (DUF6448)